MLYTTLCVLVLVHNLPMHFMPDELYRDVNGCYVYAFEYVCLYRNIWMYCCICVQLCMDVCVCMCMCTSMSYDAVHILFQHVESKEHSEIEWSGTEEQRKKLFVCLFRTEQFKRKFNKSMIEIFFGFVHFICTQICILSTNLSQKILKWQLFFIFKLHLFTKSTSLCDLRHYEQFSKRLKRISNVYKLCVRWTLYKSNSHNNNRTPSGTYIKLKVQFTSIWLFLKRSFILQTAMSGAQIKNFTHVKSKNNY